MYYIDELKLPQNVKKIIILLVCFNCAMVTAQRKPKIKGNKDVVEVRDNLPSFHSIELIDDLEIFLQKSVTPGYRITADDNLIDILKFEVVDSVLQISSFYNITAKKQLDIEVGYNELRAISLNAGKAMTESVISTDEITITTSGSSRLDMQFSAAVASLTLDGNSKVILNIDADSLTMSLRDKVDADIYSVGKSQSVELWDNAILNLEGSTDTLSLYVKGNTKLRAQKMEAHTIDVETSENANSRIYALRKLKLDSSGTSKVYLYGEPEIEILQFLDSSELYKRSE